MSQQLFEDRFRQLRYVHQRADRWEWLWRAASVPIWGVSLIGLVYDSPKWLLIGIVYAVIRLISFWILEEPTTRRDAYTIISHKEDSQ